MDLLRRSLSSTHQRTLHKHHYFRAMGSTGKSFKPTSIPLTPFQFAVARLTPYLLSNSFGGLFFFVFGITTMISMTLVWFLLPETKGVTLERMDEIFGSPYRYIQEGDHVVVIPRSEMEEVEDA